VSSSRKKSLAQYCSVCHSALVESPHEVLKIYLCSSCERRRQYGTPNSLARGQIGKLPTFSIEFEVAAPPHDPTQVSRALILLQHGFIRTYDSTVDDEYKSPIYCSLRAFRKPLAVMDTLSDLVSEQCGTHLHVGCAQRYNLYPIRRAVFDPLIEYMRAHEQETIAFWGRFFSSQARATLTDGERHVCFNVGDRYPTIEYRLPRFRSAEQYVRVLRFCRETTAFISEAINRDLSGAKRLPPEQLGERVLTRYQKAVRASQPISPTLWEEQEVSSCAD
jgi:hypothetical protein